MDEVKQYVCELLKRDNAYTNKLIMNNCPRLQRFPPHVLTVSQLGKKFSFFILWHDARKPE
jgi:hypothetical protein